MLDLVGCRASRHKGAILFSTLGTQPFRGSIWLMRPDGPGLRAALRPKRRTSHLAAAGLSQTGPFVVVIHEAGAQGATTEKLFWNDLSFRTLRAAVPGGPPFQGGPAISPDLKSLAFLGSGVSKPMPALWLQRDGVRPERITQSGAGARTWSGLPVWSPDGAAIYFTQLTVGDSGLETQLMAVTASGPPERTVLGREHGVLAICFSRDGRQVAAVQRSGLELYDARTWAPLRRIAEWHQLPSPLYRGGGITWAPDPDRIIFGVQRQTEPDLALVLSLSVASGAVSILRQMSGRLGSVQYLPPAPESLSGNVEAP